MTSEAELDAQVRQLCELYGWRRYHTYRSKRSPAGFPDLVLVKRDRLIFAELKSDDGRVSPEQAAWIQDFEVFAQAVEDAATCGSGASVEVGVYVWRPGDLEEIARTLAPR